jgi:DNA-binding NtrC family response regulator
MEKNDIAQPKVLVVDDNEGVRKSLTMVLRSYQFEVTSAANVGEALHLIDTQSFDVLLSDLHMPGAGDGFTVVSAMRHTNPNAVTLVFTGYPALKEAMDAILLQADEVLVKPMDVTAMVEIIRCKLRARGTRKAGFHDIGARRQTDNSSLADSGRGRTGAYLGIPQR